MRAGFGLVGILITIGVIVWIMHSSGFLNNVTSEPVKHAQQQANQIAGNSADGSMKFSDSVVLEPETRNGKMDAMTVTSVTAGGPAETYFGLKENDAIVGYSQNGVDTAINTQNDDEMVKAQITEAYQRQGTLTVIRDGEKMVLPKVKPAPVARQEKGKDDIQHEVDLHALPGMQ